MEEHFLKDFVADESRLEPQPWYNPDGDCIVYQFVNDAIVSDRIDEVLTIYHSAVSGNAIGYQIKGVAALVRKFGWAGISVECKKDSEELQEVSIYALLLAAYEDGPKTIGRRRAYAGVFEYCGPASRVRMDDPSLLIPAN